MVNLASWTLGLSLIVLTIAMHTTGVVMMAFGVETRIWVQSTSRSLIRGGRFQS